MKMATANYHHSLQTDSLEYVCRETLNRTKCILEDDFDPLLVQNDLLLSGILTEKECDELRCKTRRRDRLKFFLTLLKNRHQMFHKFVDVLKNFEGYEALASNLADQSLDMKLYVEEVRVPETDDQPPFDYFDMMDNVIKELKLPSIENMCKCLNMSKSMSTIKKSETPGGQFFIECRRQNIISKHDTQRLVEAARKCGLKTVEEIIEDYQRISCYPELRVTLTCGSSSAASSNNFRDFLLNKKRELKAMFKRNHGAHFVDSEEGSIVVRLKVSNAHELKRLIEDIKSGKVLESIKELYQSEASENELKNVFGKVETVEISINETDISKAESYFSTVTTDIQQRALRSVMTELEEEFDPISLLPKLEEGDFFNEGEKGRLLRTSKRADRVRLFQSYLLSKPSSKFNEFVNALSGCGHYMSLVKTLRSNLLEIEKTEYIQTTVTNTDIRQESSSHHFSRETSVNATNTDDVNLEGKTLGTVNEESDTSNQRMKVKGAVRKITEANRSSHGTKQSKISEEPMNVTDIVTKTKKDNSPLQLVTRSERTPVAADWWKVVPCHFIWKLEESADVDFRGIVNNLDSKLETRNEEEWRESACDMLLFRGYIEVSNFGGVQPNPKRAEEFFSEAEKEATRVTDDDERQAYITVVTANKLWVLESTQQGNPDEGQQSKLLTALENSWMRNREERSQKRFDAFIDATAAFALVRLGPNKYKEAERRYQRALKTIEKSSWYQSLGAVIGRQGRWKMESYDDDYDGIDDEIKCYEKAIELDKQNSSAKCDLALALLKFPERKDEARDLIGRVEGNSCEIMLKKGRFYRRDGDKQRALAVLLEGLKRIEYVRSELYYLIACLYEDFATQAKKRGNRDEKIKCNRKTTEYVDKCLEKQPTHFNAMRLKGIALGREGRKSEGEKVLRRVIEMYRHSPRCLIEAQNSLAKHLFINNNNKCNGDVAKAYEDVVDTGILILKNMDMYENNQVNYFINSAQEILKRYYNDLKNGYVKLQTLRNKLSEI